MGRLSTTTSIWCYTLLWGSFWKKINLWRNHLFFFFFLFLWVFKLIFYNFLFLRNAFPLSFCWFHWHWEKRECKKHDQSVLITRFDSYIYIYIYVCVCEIERETLTFSVNYRWVSVTLEESSALWVTVNKGWHLPSLSIASCHIRHHCSFPNINKS